MESTIQIPHVGSNIKSILERIERRWRVDVSDRTNREQIIKLFPQPALLNGMRADFFQPASAADFAQIKKDETPKFVQILAAVDSIPVGYTVVGLADAEIILDGEHSLIVNPTVSVGQRSIMLDFVFIPAFDQEGWLDTYVLVAS